MKKILFSVCVLLALVLPGSAQIFTNFAVTINGTQEVPGNASPGTGSGLVTLDTNANVLSFVGMSYSGLSGNSTLAHFHGPAGAGTNAGVLYNLLGNTTLGGTSGSFSGTVTMINNPNGSGFTIAQQIAQLGSGLWYLNIHSSSFGGGEIRGQLIPVPEPGVVVLSGIGIGLLGLRAMRRK